MDRASLRSLAKNLAASLCGVALLLAALEAALALLLPPPLRFRMPQYLHSPDPVLGWVLQPLQATYTIDQRVRTNSLGLRGPEVAASDDTRSLRVLCIGDSQTFGIGVAQDRTYPALLQALLPAPAGGRTEVINAGVPGYDTLQEVELLRRLAPRLRPDVIVLGFYLNDLSEVLRLDKTGQVASNGEFVQRGALKSLLSYRIIYAAKRSRLVTLVYDRFQRLRMGGDHPQVALLQGRAVPEFDLSWSRVRSALLTARGIADHVGARLIVFPVPTVQEFVSIDPRGQYRSRLLALARSLGVEAFDPTPALLATTGDGLRHFIPWDGHLSDSGHAGVARELAAHLGATP